MSDSLNKTPISEDLLISFANPDVLNKLSESNQKVVIENVLNNKSRDGGLMGKLFGNSVRYMSVIGSDRKRQHVVWS